MPSRPDDPITATVIQASLVAAADEMFAVLKKTAMSPIIYEVLDVGTGVTDPHGELVSSGAGIPTFVGVLDKAVKRIVELHGLDTIRDGDCFITNDPYYGGVTHLNDVVIALPVFAEGACVAWAASIAHWNDVGGKTPGSMAVDVSEIFQEGLRLPAVKLFENGKPIASVFDIIIGQFAPAGFRARRSVGANRGKPQGRDAHPPAGPDLWPRRLSYRDRQPVHRGRTARSSRSRRVAARHVPHRGRAGRRRDVARRHQHFARALDGRSLGQPEAARCALQHQPRRCGDLVPDDLQGADRPDAVCQCRLVPARWRWLPSRARSSTPRARRRTATISRPASGSPTCCGSAWPAPCPSGCRPAISPRSAARCCRATIPTPAAASPWSSRKWAGGARRRARDGLDAMYSTNHGDTFNCPVEIGEARYGIDVGYKRLNETAEGKGRHAGGKGLSVSYRPRGRAMLSAGYSRNRRPVWGSAGGANGGTNRLVGGARQTASTRPMLSSAAWSSSPATRS